jgi:hypothetical protein
MRGPYAYEPPVYWFADTLFGGAFGFNTETGPGAQVPPVESIEKMLSEQHRWPIDSVWNYHCGRHEFNNLNPYHVIYNPDQHSLFVVNDRLENLKGCTVKIRVYNKNSKLKFEKEIKTGLNANSSKWLLQLPTFKWNKGVCFLDLRLMDSRGNEIDNNFYWLSAKKICLITMQNSPPGTFIRLQNSMPI